MTTIARTTLAVALVAATVACGASGPPEAVCAATADAWSSMTTWARDPGNDTTADAVADDLRELTEAANRSDDDELADLAGRARNGWAVFHRELRTDGLEGDSEIIRGFVEPFTDIRERCGQVEEGDADDVLTPGSG